VYIGRTLILSVAVGYRHWRWRADVQEDGGGS